MFEPGTFGDICLLSYMFLVHIMILTLEHNALVVGSVNVSDTL